MGSWGLSPDKDSEQMPSTKLENTPIAEQNACFHCGTIIAFIIDPHTKKKTVEHSTCFSRILKI